MEHYLCLCESIRRFPNKTPVTIIMHRREAFKPSGTSRLASLALQDCQVHLRGHVEKPLLLEEMFPRPETCLFLNLSDRAQVLDEEGDAGVLEIEHELLGLGGSGSGGTQQPAERREQSPVRRDHAISPIGLQLRRSLANLRARRKLAKPGPEAAVMPRAGKEPPTTPPGGCSRRPC